MGEVEGEEVNVEEKIEVEEEVMDVGEKKGEVGKEEEEEVRKGRHACVTGEQRSSIGLLWLVKTRSD